MTDQELMQQALEALEDVREWSAEQAAVRAALRERLSREIHDDLRDRLGAVTVPELKERLAREEQEPVAWINWSALTGQRRLGWQCESEIASEPLYTAPQPCPNCAALYEQIERTEKMLDDQYRMGMEAEREACARVCEDIETGDYEGHAYFYEAAERCAAAIRSRGQQ